MANTVKVNIEGDASGAIRATSKTVEGLDNVGKSAKKAAETTKKANEDISKSSQGSAMQVTELNKVLGAMGIPTGRIMAGVNSFKAMTAGSKALRISLIALPFVAIAAAVMALFKAFSSTQEGADQLNAIMQPLKATLAVLWGVVQELSISIVDAFSNPRQAVIDLWEVIKQNLINRLTAIPKIFQAQFKIISKGAQAAAAAVRGIWSKSAREEAKQLFAEAAEAGVEYANAILQMQTGVEDMIGKTKNVYKGLNKEVQRGIDIGNRIAEIEKEIAQARIDSTVPLARMKREYQELNTIARNTALSEEKRIKAARQAVKVFEDMTAEQMKILNLEIERLELQVSQNNTLDEEKLQLQQLIAQREELVAKQEAGTRRLVLAEQQLLQQVEDRIEAEKQANIAYLESLELRAEKFRDMLLSEEELRQRSIEADIELIEYLVERKVLGEKEAEDIIAEMRREALEEEIEEREIHADSLLAIQEQLREQEQLFLEAGTDEERKAIAERINELKAMVDERRALLNKMTDDEIAAINRILGTSIAAGIERAKSAEEFGKEVINSIAKEAGAAAASSVFKSVPFPANVALAPIVGAATQRLIKSFVGGGGGGGGGGSVPSLSGGSALNANQQTAISSASVGSGAGQSVSLDPSAFNEAIDRFPQSIKVELDIVETTRKINDQNEINKERDIDVR